MSAVWAMCGIKWTGSWCLGDSVKFCQLISVESLWPCAEKFFSPFGNRKGLRKIMRVSPVTVVAVEASVEKGDGSRNGDIQSAPARLGPMTARKNDGNHQDSKGLNK